jgi:hypothetical protein
MTDSNVRDPAGMGLRAGIDPSRDGTAGRGAECASLLLAIAAQEGYSIRAARTGSGINTRLVE